MKHFNKEQLETVLRVYAKTGDYQSMLDLLSSHPEIDVNSKDTKHEKNALEILLDGEETVERNQTILLLSDKYGAKGLTKEKHNELSKGFLEDDDELYFDAPESPSRSNSPLSSIEQKGEGRGSPNSVAVNMDAILGESEKTTDKKTTSKMLGQEALKEYESRISSRTSTPLSSGEEALKEYESRVSSGTSTPLPTAEEAKEEELVVEEQPKKKEIERIDLTGHEEFTPEQIIERDLIAKAALQGDLTIASDMVNRVIDSNSQGAETAVKNGFSEMITVFPEVHSQADEPRNAAFIVYNNLKKQFNSIDRMTNDSREITDVISRKDFQKSRKRLPNMVLDDYLKRAQGILREELPAKVEEARVEYEKEKDKVTAITQKFTETVNLITDRIDLSDYKTPKLDHYSAELKDIVVNAMGENKQKFATSKAEDKTTTAMKTTKNISDFDAKKNVVRELPALSREAQDAISSYHAKYSKEKEAQLKMASIEDRDRIMEEVASEYQKDLKFKKEDFMDQNKIYELTDDLTYSEAFKKVFALQQTSQESQKLVRFSEGKKQEAQDVIEEIQADLVPMAVKLHQLNDQLEPDDRMDPKNLNAYINAALVAQLNQHLPERESDPTLKNKFSKIIDHPANKEALQLTEDELQRVADPKEEMKKLLEQVGLKPQILEKAAPNQEQDAVKKLGAAMLGVGMEEGGPMKRVNPFAAGKSNLKSLSRQ
ncbi:MAG: hypothetical protein N4A31_02740 [Rickettsiales bacterium]|jgi:hypothetical protein|nr:hypothetical protein [Rickettsiales bacterium]